MCPQLSPSPNNAIVAVLTGCLFIAGCNSQPAAAPAPAPALASASIEQCAANLHDLSGYLLHYYVLHRKLPATLDELRPLAAIDRPLPLVCPTSGKPYVYFAQALRSDTDPRWLLLVETEPHDGIRNAIVGADPEGNRPLGLWVIHLDEKAFASFRRPAPSAAE